MKYIISSVKIKKYRREKINLTLPTSRLD